MHRTSIGKALERIGKAKENAGEHRKGTTKAKEKYEKHWKSTGTV